MTARRSSRRQSTLIGAALIGAMLAIAGILAIVGASSVANSTAGQSVDVDERPVIEFPATANAALAVVDDRGRLASLVVATLLPSGAGGTIVTVPVNADVNVGLEPTARPLNTFVDADDPAAFFEAVENTLALSLQFGEIVGTERLAELLEPVSPVRVDLPAPVLDGPFGDAVTVVEAGEGVLGAAAVANALAAIDSSGASYDHHWIDVELWSAIAAGAGVAEPDGLSVESLDELFASLWAGPVQVRDLELQGEVESLDVDAVVLSRRDTVVLLSQISPTRVSAPGDGLIFRVVVPFSDEQIAASDGLFASRSEVARTVVGEMLFFQNNVVSVDTSAAAAGAPAITQIDVVDERLVAELQASAFVVYGEANVVLATEVIDGVDAVITLGTSYLDLKADAAVAGESAAETDVADTVDGDG